MCLGLPVPPFDVFGVRPSVGFLFPDPKNPAKKGRIVFNLDRLLGAGLGEVRTNRDTVTFKGTWDYVFPSFDSDDDGFESGACRYSFRRTSAEDPLVECDDPGED